MAKKLLMNSGGLMPVLDGLICWLDGRDGKNGDTIWKDRSGNGNDAILKEIPQGINYGFKDGCVVCSKTGGYVHLPECFYRNTNHSFFVFGETLSSSSEMYQRLFTLSSIGANNDSIRFANGKSLDISANSLSVLMKVIYTPKREEVTGVGNQYLAYSFNIDLQKMIIKYNENNFSYKDVIEKPTSTNGANCYLNIESMQYKFPRDIKFKTVLLYNRALTEAEIQQNYLYEQSIQRG